MHKCPGAEQTLSLTGFDLHGMERAVGKLCHDIPRKFLEPENSDAVFLSNLAVFFFLAASLILCPKYICVTVISYTC